MRIAAKHWAAVATAAALNGAAYAQIVIDSVIADLGLGNGGERTFITNFDPGFSDKMVIFLGAEHGFPSSTDGRFNSVTLNGVQLTEIVQEESNIPTIAAFYLDDPRAVAGVGDLVVNQDNHNQSIYSIYLLSNTAAGVGTSFANWGANQNSIALTTTAANSLVLVGHENAGPNGGNGAGNSSALPPLTEDTPYLEVGNTWTSLSTAHAYVATPSAGTYSYSGDDPSDLIAMAAVEILEGPPPPDLTLRVNTTSGALTMIGDDVEALSISYYQVTSADDSLDTTGWNSLQDQDFEGNGAPGGGNGWEEAGGSGAHAIAEAYLLGNSAIGVDQKINLGSAYNNSVDARDLEFTYLTNESKTFLGLIEYFSPLPGDLDNDGDIDNADIGKAAGSFTGAGGSTSLAWEDGDMDGDGDVDNADLGLVAGAFTGALTLAEAQDIAGLTGLQVADLQAMGVTVVPEPASLALLGLGGLLMLRRRSL